MNISTSKIVLTKKLNKIKSQHSETVLEHFDKYLLLFIQVSSNYNRAARRIFRSKTSLENEKRRQNELSLIDRYVIHPFSICRWIWDACMTVIFIASLFITPVCITFYAHHYKSVIGTNWKKASKLIDLAAATDMLLNFRSGYIETYTRKVILSSKDVAWHYLTTCFIFDFLSSIPTTLQIMLTYIDEKVFHLTSVLEDFPIKSHDGHKREHDLTADEYRAAFREMLFGLVQIFSLLRFSRLFRNLRKLQSLFHVRSRLWRILDLILVAVIALHWNSLTQYEVLVWEQFPENSWFMKKNLLGKPLGAVYVHCIFRTVSHMLSIGYGFYPPYSTMEIIFTIVSMLIGAVFYAMFLANLNHLVMQADTAGNTYDEKIGEVKQFMNYHRLSRTFQKKVIQYYETKYNQQYFDPHKLLENINPHLKAQIMYMICRFPVSQSSLFKGASREFLTDVCRHLEYEIFMRDDVIVATGQRGLNMYFIEHGRVQVVDPDGTIITTLGDGTHFGEISLLSTELASASVIAIETTHTYYLSKIHFEKVLDVYPDLKKKLLIIIKIRLERSRQMAQKKEEEAKLMQQKQPEEEVQQKQQETHNMQKKEQNVMKTQQNEQEVMKMQQKEHEVMKMQQKEQEVMKIQQKEQEVMKMQQKEQEVMKIQQKEQEVMKMQQKEQEAMTIQQKEQVMQMQEKEQEVMRIQQKEQEAMKIQQKEQEVVKIQQKEKDVMKMQQKEQEVMKIQQKEPEVMKMQQKQEGHKMQQKEQEAHKMQQEEQVKQNVPGSRESISSRKNE